MKPNVRSKLDKIFSYPFFKSVGMPLPASVTSVSSWQAAAKMCRSYKWETCQLMGRNALKRKIEARYSEDKINHYFWHRFQDWGSLLDEVKPLISNFVDDLLGKFPLKDKSLNNVRDSLSWDIMFMCLEQEYGDIVSPFFYIPIIEPWYAAGHFPCGWDGDEFPDAWDGLIRGGQLMVF